jgi:O-antigen ligase
MKTSLIKDFASIIKNPDCLENIIFYQVCLLVFIFSFNRVLMPIFFILLLTTAITYTILHSNLSSKFKGWLFILLFFIIITSLFLNGSFNTGKLKIEKYLFFIIIPILFYAIANILQNKRNKILNFYIAGVFVSTLFCISNSLINSITFIDGEVVFNSSYWSSTREMSFFELISHGYSHFSYKHLAFFQPPIYQSLYINFAISIIITRLKSYSHLNFSASIMKNYSILFIYFSIYNYMLQSRIGIFINALLIIYFIINLKSKYRYSALAISIVILAFLTINSRIHHKLQSKENFRVHLYQNAFDVILEKPYLGYGIEAFDKKIEKQQYQLGLTEHREQGYNAHNQFLQIWGESGIAALIVFILIIVYPFLKENHRKDELFIIFQVIFLFTFLIESLLNRQFGIQLYVFFYMLFIYIPEKNQKNNYKLLHDPEQ